MPKKQQFDPEQALTDGGEGQSEARSRMERAATPYSEIDSFAERVKKLGETPASVLFIGLDPREYRDSLAALARALATPADEVVEGAKQVSNAVAPVLDKALHPLLSPAPVFSTAFHAAYMNQVQKQMERNREEHGNEADAMNADLLVSAIRQFRQGAEAEGFARGLFDSQQQQE